MKAETLVPRAAYQRLPAQRWFVLIGLAVLAIPTFTALGREHWSTEAGAHSPLVIVTAGWLVWRRIKEGLPPTAPGSAVVVFALLVAGLLMYIFGRAFDYLTLQATGFYIVVLAAVYDNWGTQFLRHVWFPLLYLAFALPVPGWVIDTSTAPLKDVASWATTEGLQLVGIPIVREGVILFVAQYQLLVEDACAGMNAIMGLISLGLFYSYLTNGSSWRRALLLTAFILPIAIAANIIRIGLLVLITYWFGDDAAQGYLHNTAGLVMFASALLLVFLVDAALARMIPPRNAVR